MAKVSILYNVQEIRLYCVVINNGTKMYIVADEASGLSMDNTDIFMTTSYESALHHWANDVQVKENLDRVKNHPCREV